MATIDNSILMDELSSDKYIIGRNTLVDIIDSVDSVPAKIDTGADSSAIWATNIHVDEAGRLHYVLFGEGSEFYDGKDIVTDEFGVAQVRSSSGHIQVRYRTTIAMRIASRKIKVLCNLSDRSQNEYPILIGRRTLSGKFIVDVARREHHGTTREITQELRKELKENPYEFYKKYHTTK